MVRLKIIVGIMGVLSLASITVGYCVAKAEPENAQLGASPESDKNIGPAPTDSPKTFSNKKTKRSKTTRAGKKRGSGADKSKSQSDGGIGNTGGNSNR